MRKETAALPVLPTDTETIATRELTGARFYRPELDLLRFFAFAAVYIHHSIPEPSSATGLMWKAVPRNGMGLFFVLSSFLITELLLRERNKTGTVHIGAFYVRRILRIWPLYFTFIALCVIAGWMYPIFRLRAELVVAFVLFAGNWYSAFRGAPGPIGPLWSISVEEQFYLLWPTLAKFGGRKAIWIFSLCLFPVAWIALAALTSHPRNNPDLRIWFDSFVQFQFFGIGALLALVLSGKAPRLNAAARLLLIGLGVVCWCLSSFGSGLGTYGQLSTEGVISGFTLIGIGCVLIFMGFLGMEAKHIPKPLIYFGKISYGLYVVHWFCMELLKYWLLNLGVSMSETNLLRPILALPCTFALAILSYRYLEQPFLRLKEHFTFVHSRSV